MKSPKVTHIITALALSLGIASASLPAYAESEPITGEVSYILYYSAPGAENIPAPTTFTCTEDIAIAVVSDSTPYRADLAFAGWSWTDDGTPDFFPGDHITLMSRETTIYATWSETAPIATARTELIDSDDPGFMPLGDTADPLGRMTASQATAKYGLLESTVIAIGAIMCAIFVAGGTYILLDLKQTMDK